ncbi:MAG TPA: cyclodeaminase/cyclohydrolase family protein [Tepidisphaeraceae bacterium]|jgi:formiminotetrahydrofolate cyclodeaminase|nr:cyclodeaminase/cyclohydrolase family protein [Tepidisphaeraceae bacterium]
MTYDSNNTIAQFLDGTAAKQPAPGGGSVTALVGALSAAIGEMVLNYSVGKKGLEAHQPQLQAALKELHRARQLMAELMVEDQTAYQALTAARKLTRDSAEWKSDYPPAVLASIRTPEAIAATAAAILATCDRLVDSVNFYLLSDLAVCAELAMATVRCGVYNVRVNQSSLTDASDRERVDQTIAQILLHATSLIQRVIPRIWDRNAQGK